MIVGSQLWAQIFWVIWLLNVFTGSGKVTVGHKRHCQNCVIASCGHRDYCCTTLKDFNTSTPGLTPFGASVPSSVDAVIPGVLGRRGVAMYRRTFQQKGPVRLQFMGCSFYCRVFVDGKEVGEHRAGGFVPWWLDVAPSGMETATRELFVLVDNRFNRTTAPVHTGGDFWHYGGLVRSVLLHDLPDDSQKPWVWRAHVLPSSTSLAQASWQAMLRFLVPVVFFCSNKNNSSCLSPGRHPHHLDL